MQTNKLNSLDKCIILLSYVNDRNPSVFIEIIQSLPKHHSQEILTRLKSKPLYSKEDVHAVLDEHNSLTVERDMLFPSESFKEHLQNKLSAVNSSSPSSKHSNYSFLDSLSKDTLLTLIEKEPSFFTGLLCHMLPKNEFATLLSDIPSDTAKEGLSYYTKIRPCNQSFLYELTEYYLDYGHRLNQTTVQNNISQSKDIAQILELLPESNKDMIKSILPSSVSWKLVEESLLSIEDIQFYSPNDQQIILSSIEPTTRLAHMLSILPSTVRTDLIHNCLTTRQSEIVMEELNILKNKPLTDEQISELSNDLIQLIRKLEREQKITEISSATGRK